MQACGKGADSASSLAPPPQTLCLFSQAVAAASCAAAARTPKLGQAPVAFFGSGLLIPYYVSVEPVAC